jgi:RimJ/RimL family protein N-acetyltransferase
VGTPAEAAGPGGALARADGVAPSGAVEELRTARLRLRPYRRTDFETLFRELVSDPVVIRFWHAYGAPGLTDLDRRAMAERDLGAWIERGVALGYPTWVIEIADAGAGPPGDFVGVIGVFPPENEWGPEPEVGYLLASRHHGRGLATEALAAVIAEAADRRHFPSLVGIVDEPNVASIRVLEKCGFAFERPYTGSDGHPYRRYVRRSVGRPADGT